MSQQGNSVCQKVSLPHVWQVGADWSSQLLKQSVNAAKARQTTTTNCTDISTPCLCTGADASCGAQSAQVSPRATQMRIAMTKPKKSLCRHQSII